MTVAVAGHPNVGGADNDENATWANIADMRERYGAHSIRIEVGMGHRDGSLADAAKNFLRDAFNRFENGADDIRTLTGTLDTGAGIPNDEINLIGDLLDVKEELSFPENNWGQFYILRRDLLRTKLNGL